MELELATLVEEKAVDDELNYSSMKQSVALLLITRAAPYRCQSFADHRLDSGTSGQTCQTSHACNSYSPSLGGGKSLSVRRLHPVSHVHVMASITTEHQY
jgi:hypothetical protein